MAESFPELQAPAAGELADDHDADDWSRDRDGRMADHAAPDDAVATVPWEDDD